MEIRAVAFDLDGTLYPNRSVYLRLVPFAVAHPRLLIGLGKVRDQIRRMEITEPYYDVQARLLGQRLGMEPSRAKALLEKRVYRGWEPIFHKVKLYPQVWETIAALRTAGLSLGLLSDFPPETKIQHLGLSGIFDTVLASEETGHIKPDARPFLALASALALEPAQILYVGNNYKVDVLGALDAGMKAAWRGRGGKGLDPRVFRFTDYRKLRDYVLTLTETGRH
jgi:HAD superfamily hydrolase (TIGR01549 family)